MSAAGYLCVIVLCLMFQGFFAAVEIAFLSCNRVKIRHLAQQRNRRARWVDEFLAKPVKYLSTTMIGVNLAVVVGASFATELAGLYVDRSAASIVATLGLWPLILLFGEFIPMSTALVYSHILSLWGVAGLKIVYGLFYPFVRMVAFISNIVNRLAGGKQDLTAPYFTRDELRLLFRDTGRGPFDKAEERMIRGVFEFHKVKVSDIMVPLKDVISSPADATVGSLKKVVFDSGYSRIPVYRSKPENIVGFIHAADLIGADDDLTVEPILRAAIKISRSRSAAEVLQVMWGHQINMAIVMGTQDRSVGIVTMEDILEEIVGEIEDEYDSAAAQRPENVSS